MAVDDAPPQHPAPPDRPELPEGVERRPDWPWWYGAVGFVVALFGVVVAVGIIAAVTGTDVSDDKTSVTFTIFSVLVQNAIFIGVALGFASLAEKPRAWQFGLRGARLWPSVGWAALGMVAFYVFSAVYSVVVHPDVDQGVTQELGADQGTIGLIIAGFMVVVVAPLAEEFFFRGFLFRTLRNSLPLLIAAALAGGVFGLLHWDGSSNGLLIIPPLAVLGFIFCLVYEKTGSLLPTIALHAINNSIAYAAQTHGDGAYVSLVAGPLMIAACIAAPRFLPRHGAWATPAPGTISPG